MNHEETRLPPTVIGYREWIAIPAWGIMAVRAKADTGAKTSAIDVRRIKIIDDSTVQFDFVRHRYQRRRTTTIQATISRRSFVKSSTGESKKRIFVTTEVVLGTIRKQMEFSLVSRRGMLNRVLLGRAALMDDFLIDAGQRYLLGKPSLGDAS